MNKLAIPVVVAALALSACGMSAADKAAQSAAATASSSATSGEAAGGAYPVTVDSCGTTLVFDEAPETVLNLGGTGMANLEALGLLDQIDLRAGSKNFGEGQEALQARYDAIPALESSELDTGGVKLATEVVMAAKVDLIIGYDSGVDREALAKAGIQLYSPAAFCPDYSVEHATWELIDAEINNLATIFGVPDKAAEVIGRRQEAVAALGGAGTATGATAAALYITPGDANFYAYGTSSMVQPIFEANGVKNIYDDNTTRVFDASMEDLLARNPEWIVLLPGDATEREARETFLSFQGARDLQAVANDHVVVIPFALTDPPNMLSVLGASTLAEKLAAK